MDSFEANGRRFTVVRSLSRNKNAWARLRGDVLTISIPSRWPDSEKRRISDDLLGKSIRSIEKGRWTGESAGRIVFKHGQRVKVFGKEFEIIFMDGRGFRSRVLDGRRIVVEIDPLHPDRLAKASALAKACLVKVLKPELEARVRGPQPTSFQRCPRKDNDKGQHEQMGELLEGRLDKPQFAPAFHA